MKYRIVLEKVGSYTETLENTDLIFDAKELKSLLEDLKEKDDRFYFGWYKLKLVDNETDETVCEVED